MHSSQNIKFRINLICQRKSAHILAKILAQIKIKSEKINLEKGYILLYDFGKIKVYNYNTVDYIDDQVILLEKDNKIAIIDPPTFYDKNKELEEYISSLNVKADVILLSYHMAGGTFLDNAKKYPTTKAEEYGHNGGKNLVDGFTKAFGESFDKNIHNVTDYINEGTITLADIKLNIIPTAEAYDIEIPEINVVYTHMLGSNCHFIIAGRNLAATMIETLEGYLDKNYNLILTSHYIPEDINAVKVKIAYIKRLLTIAETSYNAKEMIDKVKMNIMVV